MRNHHVHRVERIPMDQFSAKKNLLFNQLLKDKGLRRNSLSSIGRISDEEPKILSSGQMRMWFLDQTNPGSTEYIDSYAIQLSGELSLGALQASINTLIQRHESLRTCTMNAEGRPLQRICDNISLNLEIVRLEPLRTNELATEIHRQICELSAEPFELNVAPLWRFRLLEASSDEHTLLFTCHHLIWDGLSYVVFFKELVDAYQAICENCSPDFPQLPIRYVDYAHYEQQRLINHSIDDQAAFWKHALSGYDYLSRFPFDRIESKTDSTNAGASEEYCLPQEISQRMIGLTREVGVTPFVLFVTVYNVLLYCYTGVHDTIIGISASGRTTPETCGVIGMFVNTLPLRVNIKPTSTFSQLLNCVKLAFHDVFANQEIPYNAILAETCLPPDVTPQSVIETYALQEVIPAPVVVNTIRFTPRIVQSPCAKFPLEMWVIDQAMASDPKTIGGHSYRTTIRLQYNKNLFRESTVRGLLEQFQTIFSEILDSPGIGIDDLTHRFHAHFQKKQSIRVKETVKSKTEALKNIRRRSVRGNNEPQT